MPYDLFVPFTLIGLAYAIWIAFVALHDLILGIRAHLVGKAFPVRKLKSGGWAVVTGSTDGIGKAYASELAKRGINVILISRNEKKLEEVSREIGNGKSVEVKTIAADFSKGEEIYGKIKKELENVPVEILVNNVGKQYKHPMCVGEVDEKDLWDIMNVNIGATIMMTRIVLPKMAERRRGVIVNVSSGSELQPLPFMTVYAASKAFIKSFSDALRFEYRKYGITVQHLSPMFVNTKMNDFSHRLRETGIFVPDAETYAKNALNSLGILNNSTGYWAHGLQSFLTTILPVWMRTYIGAMMNEIFIRDYQNSSSRAETNRVNGESISGEKKTD